MLLDRFKMKELAVQYMAIQNPATRILLERERRRWIDKCRQGLANNLWGNNPGELDRWADDGGKSE